MEQISLQETDGFLSDKYSITIDKIKTSYKEWFALVQKINCLIYDMYTNFDVKNNDTIGMYLIDSFAKSHKSFQACSILYSYGLEDAVCIIFRTMLESLFVASSIKKDSNNFNKLLKNQEIENTIETNHLIKDGVTKDKKIQSVNFDEKTSIYNFAKLSDYEEMYNTAYSYLSSYVHIDLNALAKNFIFKKQKVYSICISPSADDLCFILTEAVGLMLAYIDIVKDYLIKDYTIELDNLKLFHKQLQSRNN